MTANLISAATKAAQFQLGQVVATPGALEALEVAGDDARALLRRHLRLEQGALGAEDWNANRLAASRRERVFSAFQLRDGVKVWVITEADRSSTCLLLPSEY